MTTILELADEIDAIVAKADATDDAEQADVTNCASALIIVLRGREIAAALRLSATVDRLERNLAEQGYPEPPQTVMGEALADYRKARDA